MTITTNSTYVQPAWAPPQQTAQIGYGANQVGTRGATYTYLNCELGSQFSVAFVRGNSGSTIEAINPQPGQSIAIFLKQDATTGSGTVAWDSWLWHSGSAPTLSTTVGTTDVILGTWNDTLAKWVGSSILAIS